MKIGFAAGVLSLLVPTCSSVCAEDALTIRWPLQRSRSEIRQSFHGSDIVVSTSSRTAGAIDSLTWSGREFVNAFDHGRELQSAASFDEYGECLNPTEAGSGEDGTGATSSSRLDQIRAGRNWFQTKSQMAFWLAPGQTSPGCPKGPGPYTKLRSDYGLAKYVSIGVQGVANAIEYRATFSVPRAHDSATYEVATAYMPPSFKKFWTYDPARKALSPLSDGPGEQGLPVILATQDGSYAMGVYSPDLPQDKFSNQGYGRWSFVHLAGEGNATTKWSCVFRERSLKRGERTYTCFVLVGTLQDVQNGMRSLHTMSGRHIEAIALEPRRNSEALHDAAPTIQDRNTLKAERGVSLYVGTEPNCNAAIITTDPRYGGCATSPIGSTLANRSTSSGPLVYVSTADGPSAGVVTSNPDHLNTPTKPIGFLLPIGSEGVPVYVGTQNGCNAGVASTNPTHLNCSGVPLGATLR